MTGNDKYISLRPKHYNMQKNYMKTKTTLVLAMAALFLSQVVHAQDNKNVVKLNIFALGVQNFSLQYERAFTKKSSAALGFSFMPSRALPTSLTDSDSSGLLKGLSISGFSVTPEYRWYPGSEDGAPNGFYLAPYLRYASYSMSTDYAFTDPMTNTTALYPFEATYSGFGGGLMFGAQWLIKGKFSIDWWILGAHYGASTVTAAIDMDLSALGPQGQAEMQAELNKIQLPIGTSTTKVTNSGVDMEFSGLPFAGIRSGLTLGWAF